MTNCQEIYVQKCKNSIPLNVFLHDVVPSGLFVNDTSILPSLNSLYQTVITPSVTRLDFTHLKQLGTLTTSTFAYFNQILDEILVKVPLLQNLNVKSPNSRTCLPSFATHHLKLLSQHCHALKLLDISFHNNGLKNEDLLLLAPVEAAIAADQDHHQGCPELG